MQVFLGATGTVRNAVEMYKQGQLQPASGPSVPGHFGMGQTGAGVTPGPAMGGGMGRGMGMDRGMSRGMGRGVGMGIAPSQPTSAAGPGQQDLETLKSQIKSLQDQMGKITQKLETLSKKKK